MFFVNRQMRIPLEHFDNTPVYALSPNKAGEGAAGAGAGAGASAASAAAAAAAMASAHSAPLPSHCKDKKSSLPVSLGLLGTNDRSVGSAPSSPSAAKRSLAVDVAREAKEEEGETGAGGVLPTISAEMAAGGRRAGTTVAAADADDFGPISLPAGHQKRIAKYATLPKKYQ